MKVTQIGKYYVDVDFNLHQNESIMEQLSDILAKEIQKEIDMSVMQQVYENKGWARVIVKDYSNITGDWCKKYLKKEYQALGHYWYFECEKDAHFFLLKWGN